MANRISERGDVPTEYEIALSNQQSRHAVDEPRLIQAAEAVLHDSPYFSAAISLAIVDDPTIHELNRRHLNHDWPTDVLSFVLEDDDTHLDGEVIISADTAASAADEVGVASSEEQLLYVIHGMLHLVGYCDKSADEARDMRAAEDRYLQQFGVFLRRTLEEGSEARGAAP
jgi:probable rRNA maturation factor